MHVQVRNNNVAAQIILPDYYRHPAHVEQPYRFGIYGWLPPGPVFDFYSETFQHQCSDWMEWAYNNPRQPTAERDTKTGKRLPFLDGSRANSVKILGSLKNIWKEFERAYNLHSLSLDQIDINILESQFWEYFFLNYRSQFEQSVATLEQYVRERRAAMTSEMRAKEYQHAPYFSNDSTWHYGCREYLAHLIYTSPRGFLYELILFAALCQITGDRYAESTPADERRGIDGYLIRPNTEALPISLKPSSYRGDYVSPLCTECWVKYRKKTPETTDLVFDVMSGKDRLFCPGTTSAEQTPAC